MENKTTIIYLDHFDDLSRAMSIVRKICDRSKDKHLIVSSNFNSTALTDLGLELFYFDDFLSMEDYDFMERYVFDLTQNWYRWLRPCVGTTGYDEINFGNLAEERAQYAFTTPIKILQIAINAISRFRADAIILIGETDIFRDLSVFIENELNVSSSFIKIRNKESLSNILGVLRGYLKQTVCRAYDYMVKKIITKKKYENLVFIDYHLHSELCKGTESELNSYPYIIETSLRTRFRLLLNKGFSFTPILVEDFFFMPKAFGRFYRYWSGLKKNEGFTNRFRYKNIKIWKALEGSIKKLIISDFPQAKENIIFLKKLYGVLKPKVVVLREAVRMPEKTIVFTARRAGIPSLVIQHGVLGGPSVHTKIHSDKIALWGSGGIDFYNKYSNDISKCVVTGNHKYDLIHFEKRKDYKEEFKGILSGLGADCSKETILYLPAHFKFGKHKILSVYLSQDEECAALNSILNVARVFPNKQIIVKLHPFDIFEPGDLVHKLRINERYNNLFIVKDADLKILIQGSSMIIVSHFSSSVIDAVIYNKPVITLNLYKKEDFVPYAQRGVAISINKFEDLPLAVNRIFKDKTLTSWMASNRENFIHDYAYKIDGRSKERILSLIADLSNGYRI